MSMEEETVRFRRGVALVAALVLAAMALAACGDDAAVDTTDAPTTTAAAVTTAAPSTTAAPATTAAPGTTAAPDTTTGETTGTTIEVTTLGDRFSVSEIRVKAGQEVTIIVTDIDVETDDPHNFHVRAGDLNFFTNIEEAPNTQEITFTIQEPGEYEFFCDTHALTMTGLFIVEE